MASNEDTMDFDTSDSPVVNNVNCLPILESEFENRDEIAKQKIQLIKVKMLETINVRNTTSIYPF
jgi:hypothetical protein